MASAVIGGVIAGPVGAIVGSAGSKRTIGTATNVYGLSPIDQGNLIITNQRMMFLGARDTLSTPYSEIVRFSVANRHPQYRIMAEYAGREPGEQYGVDQEQFVTNMWRRANVQLGAPAPSAPLPETLPFSVVSFDHETKALA
jgi:hypothetical protein